MRTSAIAMVNLSTHSVFRGAFLRTCVPLFDTLPGVQGGVWIKNHDGEGKNDREDVES